MGDRGGAYGAIVIGRCAGSGCLDGRSRVPVRDCRRNAGRRPRPRTWCRRRSPGWQELPSMTSTMFGDGWWWLPAGCAWTGSARPTPAGRQPSRSPPEAAAESTDPADRLTLDDEVRRALAVVLDRLSPAERTSFILHDIFGFPFDAVAELVGRTPAACRQLARRARLSMRTGSFRAGLPSAGSHGRVAAELAQRFISVCDGGDLRGLIQLLDPDVAGLATVLGLPPLPPVGGPKRSLSAPCSFSARQQGSASNLSPLRGEPQCSPAVAATSLRWSASMSEEGGSSTCTPSPGGSVPRRAEPMLSLFPRLLRRCVV